MIGPLLAVVGALALTADTTPAILAGAGLILAAGTIDRHKRS